MAQELEDGRCCTVHADAVLHAVLFTSVRTTVADGLHGLAWLAVAH